MTVNNIAYRDWLARDSNFDLYRLNLRGYWEHGNGHVLAVRQINQWSSNAPPAAYAPVILRGYKIGQYLGKDMSSLEAEERLRLAARWTATIFSGVACLYGGDLNCTDHANVYPNIGAGVQFVVKPKEKIVANLEFAMGKSDNYGIYLRMGYAY